MMWIPFKYALNLFDLWFYRFYLNSFLKRRRIWMPIQMVLIFALAALRSSVDRHSYPKWYYAVIVLIFASLVLFYEGKWWSKLVLLTVFLGVAFLLEPARLVLLHMMGYEKADGENYVFYVTLALMFFFRWNLIYVLCRLYRLKWLHFSMMPVEIVAALLAIPVIAVVNCGFTVKIAIAAGDQQSLMFGLFVVISGVANFYFILYMMEHISHLLYKRYEDEMYREEMHFKELYYTEIEERNEYVQTIRHNMKHKLIGLNALLDAEKMVELSEELSCLCKEMEKRDWKIYCENPIVNSVLQVKLGAAREEHIRKDISIQIPKEMLLNVGDTGVLYGNLLDNAIEACRKLPEEKRFLKLENKYISGKLILILTNSKLPETAFAGRTTKRDDFRHGHGINSVRRVVEKYNGTVEFADRGDTFEVSLMLYGMKVESGN